MKRERDDGDDAVAPAVAVVSTQARHYQDVVIDVVHNNLALTGVARMPDLLAWHSTCRRFFNAWYRSPYLLALINAVFQETERQYKLTYHGRFFVYMGYLDEARITLMLVDYVRDKFLAQAVSDAFDFDDPGIIEWKDQPLEHILRSIAADDARLVGLPKVPSRICNAIRRTDACIRRRYGWRLYFGAVWPPRKEPLQLNMVANIALDCTSLSSKIDVLYAIK